MKLRPRSPAAALLLALLLASTGCSHASLFDDLVDKVTDLGQEIKDITKKAGETIGGAAEDTIKTVGGGAKEALKSAAELVDDIVVTPGEDGDTSCGSLKLIGICWENVEKSVQDALAAAREKVAAAVDTALENVDSLKDFYGKWADAFSINMPDEERSSRLPTFEANLRDIQANNKYANATYIAAPNQFTHLTFEEFADKHLGAVLDEDLLRNATRRSTAQQPSRRLLRELQQSRPPASMDWRKAGVVTSVKHQGECNTCWAFAAAAAVEAKLNIVYNTKKEWDLSEQQLVDCSGYLPGTFDNCKQGNDPAYAFNYMHRLQMAEEAAKPYKPSGLTCDYYNSIKKLGWPLLSASPGYQMVKEVSDLDLMEMVAEQPVLVSMTVGTALQHYRRGIVPVDPSHYWSEKDDCHLYPKRLHAVTIVGYDTTRNTPYWIVKNSWGADWGYGGYFYMPMVRGRNGLGGCDLNRVVYAPLMNS